MRGEIISKEYNSMAFVSDKNGKEYVCYSGDLKSHKRGEDLSENERKKCVDTSLVLGDSW